MKSRWTGFAVLAAMWAFALAVFGRLPLEVPTHWGLDGRVDGWSPRWPGAFIAPVAATAVFALLLGAGYIDPRRRNVERSRENRLLIATLVVLFLAWVEGLTLGAALGWVSDITTGMMIGLGLLLVGMGNYLPRIRSNWWIGIRTPWTMDNEQVWRDTQRVGGRVFVAGGLLLMAAPLAPVALLPWILGVVIAAMALVPLAYSFVAWKRQASDQSRTP